MNRAPKDKLNEQIQIQKQGTQINRFKQPKFPSKISTKLKKKEI